MSLCIFYGTVVTCDLSVYLLVSKVSWGESLNSAIVKQHNDHVWGHKRNRGHTEVKGFLERGHFSATVEKWVMVLLHIKKVPGTKPVCVQFAYMSTPFPCTVP